MRWGWETRARVSEVLPELVRQSCGYQGKLRRVACQKMEYVCHVRLMELRTWLERMQSMPVAIISISFSASLKFSMEANLCVSSIE